MCDMQVGPECWVAGVDCNVSSPAEVDRLADAAASLMGSVDVWISNAGFCAGFQVTPCQLPGVSVRWL